MSRARILILSFSHIASDARVLKQVTLLADRYDVTTCGYGGAPDPRVTHLPIPDGRGVRHWTRRDLALRRYRRIYWNLPGITEAQRALAGQDRFDVVLANDVDSVGLALALDPRHGVHADIHEYAPRQNEEQFIWRVFEAPYVRWLCRTFLRRAASMTTVGQGIAAEYRRVFGLEAGVVTNAAPYAALSPRPTELPLRLVHSGAPLRNRRLEILVDAALATSTPVVLDLYLMGNDPAYVAELQARAAGSDRVRFPEAVPYRELIETLNGYDLGLPIVAPTNFNLRWALPNKFFDFVQARLGLVIGPSPEMRTLLEQYDLGTVADEFTAPALTEVLDSLTVEKVEAWKASAERAAHPLSSEAQVAVWAAAIEALLARA